MDGCVKEDFTVIPSFFEIKVDASMRTHDTDNWIFIHNSEGILLDAKRFESGETKIFRNKDVSGNLTVTVMSITESDSTLLKSYTGVPAHQKWVLRDDTKGFDIGTLDGELEVTIAGTDLGAPENSVISNALGSYNLLSWEEDLFHFYPVPVSENLDNVFVFCTDNDETPLYKFIEHVSTGKRNLSLADFDSFDALVDINFPSTSEYVIRVKAFAPELEPNRNYGYTLNQFASTLAPQTRSSFTLGYLAQFSNSLTVAMASYGDYSLGYESYGPTPTSSISLTNNITSILEDKTFSNFEVSSPEDFDWYQTTWVGLLAGGQTVNWHVYGDGSALNNYQTIPDVIKKEDPRFEEVALTHANTKVYKGTWSYQDMINHEFKGEALQPYVMNIKELR
jgi:hypothetical protein